MYSIESSGSSRMVTNEKLAREVDEKKKLTKEKTKILDEALEEVKNKIKEMVDAAQTKEDEYFSKGKKKVSKEDEIPEPHPPLGD